MLEVNENETWTCPVCGTINHGKFCTGCGTRKPADEPVHTEPQPSVIDAEVHTANEAYTGAPAPKAPAAHKAKKEKKNHPVALAVLCALLGAGAGFGGGYAYNMNNGGNGGTTVVYQEVPTAETTNTSTTTATTGMTIKDIAAKAAPSVVEIQTEITQTTYGIFGGTYTSEAAGSGVIISKDGYIITNNHVVADANSISVKTYDGTMYDATLVGTDEKADIAVIKVTADSLTPATIGDSSTIAVGDTAVVIGNPLGTLGGTVTNGIISATDREITINNQAMNLIQTNAAINNGNSGGGLFNANGDLIGIVNAKDSGMTSSGATIEGLGFAIPINDAMDVAQQLMEYGYVADRATIGVTLQTLSQDYGSYPAGLYIASVAEGTGAEEAGLQPYDRIIGADGTEVSSYTDLSRILQNKKVGDVLTLTIVRDGKQMDVDVTLGNAINPAETVKG